MSHIRGLEDGTSEIRGVVLSSSANEKIVDGLRRGIGALFAGDREEHFVATPVISRRTSERAGYPTTFPQLLGAVHGSQDGDEPTATDLVLTSAACHHLYPLLAGKVLGAPTCLSVEATCYRGEKTYETGRLRSFRMYEVVRFGQAGAVEQWRDRALRSADQWLSGLGLSTRVVQASDPFFGRTGDFLARTQREQQLKWEITAELTEDLSQAIASANYHKEYFGEAFEITNTDGSETHSACLAFGLDRITLALRHAHGVDTSDWPLAVRANLAL
ncbi:aminoacyl--tRNA ligase-related protein [Kitasatospora sp. GP82]|uniref:aminoacyl--tRNA ligase-related protein n=1 Tax=Kitasatospora sp. GP82 TaxID=3035089 RepID=UPI0024772CC5|nr:aminoacyl--tRNA ligase-related protein [Kitasatospora sp. GP82]